MHPEQSLLPAGTRVHWRGAHGTVRQYDPLASSMCDVLVGHDDGSSCWYASAELCRTDGAPIPDRWVVRKQADICALAALQAIRARHVAEFDRPWPGANFVKAIIGQALDGAIDHVRSRLA